MVDACCGLVLRDLQCHTIENLGFVIGTDTKGPSRWVGWFCEARAVGISILVRASAVKLSTELRKRVIYMFNTQSTK